MNSPICFKDLVVPAYLVRIGGGIPFTEGTRWPCIKTGLFALPGLEKQAREEYNEIMAIPIADPLQDDNRRELHELNNKEEGWSVQAFLMKAGIKDQPVGKHYHEKKVEVFLMLEGRVEELLTAHKTAKEVAVAANLGPGTLIVIPKLVAHTFYMEPGSRMLCYSSRAFDSKDKDMVAVPGLI